MSARDFSIYNYMVGDWVICENLDINDKNKVTQSYKTQLTAKDFASYYNGNDEYVRYKPIPLSGEVLEELGLHKCVTYSRDYITNELQTHRHDMPIISVSMQYDDGRDIGNQIHYVHELQHLLKLVGIDKEIEL